MQASFVYITASDRKEAESLARMLVTRRLAACANILPSMESVYRWEEEIETDSEVVLIAKTRTELVEALTEAVVEAHSYDVPCVVAWPLAGGNPAFLEWIAAETAAP